MRLALAQFIVGSNPTVPANFLFEAKMIRKGIWYFILGFIPVVVVLGIPILLYYFLGKEIFSFIVLAMAFIVCTGIVGMTVDLFWQEHKKSLERMEGFIYGSKGRKDK